MTDTKECTARMGRLEDTLKEYVDLIEVLNEKTQLQSEALKDVRQNTLKRI
jgi:hypothetical protein